MSLRKKILSVTVISNLALLLVSAVYSFLTVTYAKAGSEFIPCFVKNRLHFYCPGCGGSRAVIALFRLDIIASVRYNPLPLIMLLIILYADALALISVVKGSYYPIKSFNLNILIIIPVAAILFFFLRLYLVFGLGIDYIGDILK